jgi:hypothetical protein
VRPISFFRAPDRADGRRSAAPSLADAPSSTSSPCVSGGDIADFSFALSDFKTLGAFFCNFCSLSFLRSSAWSARAHLLYLVGSRLPSREFNLFNLLRRHFRATPFCRQALPRRDCGDRNASVQRPPTGPAISAGTVVRTNIERLRNSGENFVERHDQGHAMCLIASVAASRSSAKPEGEAISTRYVSALHDIAYAPRRCDPLNRPATNIAEWGNFAERHQTSVLSPSSSVTSSARRSPVKNNVATEPRSGGNYLGPSRQLA